MEPAYSLTIPSVDDDITLDCRVYHPRSLTDPQHLELHALKGTVIAHPYGPLGGSYDDPVVLAVTESMVSQGYVVATFNFRGAGQSAGRTTWTGRAETEDYVSVAGFLVYYLHYLSATDNDTDTGSLRSTGRHIDMVLAGYSYGSLVLAKLPPLPQLIERFRDASLGTSVAEVVMRAHTLAEQTQRTIQQQQDQSTSRGHGLIPGTAHNLSPSKQRTRPVAVTVGGEETEPSQRRSSRDSRRSVDVMRRSVDVPRKIKAHIRKHSSQASATSNSDQDQQALPMQMKNAAPIVSVRYLLISPVMVPFTTTLCPPGSPVLARTVRKGEAATKSARLFSQHPTLAIFGSSDAFTHSRMLRAWAERETKESTVSNFEWKEIDGAGHFWREQGAMPALQERLVVWLKGLSSD